MTQNKEIPRQLPNQPWPYPPVTQWTTRRGREAGRGGKEAPPRQSAESGPSSGSECEEGSTTGKSGRGSLRPRAMGCKGRKPERTASTTRRCSRSIGKMSSRL